VWHLLKIEATSVKQVAEAIGITPQTIRRAIRTLAGNGLSRPNADGTHTACDRPLDEVAEELGVLDRTRRRVALNSTHRRERELFLDRPRPAPDVPATFDPKNPSVVDPTTGEIFYAAAFDAATVLLGGALRRRAVAA